mgnify:CR=1 FL=1
MTRTDVIIVGAGQAGLAMSHCLTMRGIDHLIVERGRIAERWRSERWDSLKLLTPNWMTRLPGWHYGGPVPDGFMDMAEVVAMFERYQRSFSAPVIAPARVHRVSQSGNGYRVETSRGAFAARAVVVATGHCDRPHVPDMARGLPDGIRQIVPSHYRNAAELDGGGVLVVGASATGIQLAEEIHASGRPVTLAAGHHTRLPRCYRGRDIMVWLDRIGTLDQRWDEVGDLEHARRQPSLQLVGRDDHSSIDLASLAAQGVRIVGRAVAAEGGCVHFAGDLARRIARAEDKLQRLVARIDAHIAASRDSAPTQTIARIELDCPAAAIDLGTEGIRTVIWATGYRRNYGWLGVPVLDQAGEIRHQGGITPAPGLYALGLRFMRRRKSSFIDGVGRDAEELTHHLAAHLSNFSDCAA